jgi:hypothetical protein
LTQVYPWYEIVKDTDELEQGDFIEDFEVLIPTYIPDETEIDTPNYRAKGISNKYNVVIVSQSCDLDNGKLEYVLLCPRIDYSLYIEENKQFGAKAITKNLQNIEKGWQPKYCMLNKCDLPELPCEIQLVELGKVYSVPYNILKQMIRPYSKRLRLLSPYKEKLAQAFAYYYMRVALPINIENFETAKIQTKINPKPLS